MELSPKTTRSATYVASFVCALFLGLVVSFFYEQGAASERVVRGIECSGREVSGLPKRALEAFLEERGSTVGARRVELSLGSEKKVYSLLELGVSLDVDRVTEDALRAGRRGSIFSKFGFWLARLFTTYEVPAAVRTDEGKLQMALKSWTTSLLQAPELPSLTYENDLVVAKGHGGTVIEYPKLVSALKEVARFELGRGWTQGTSASIEVPTKNEAEKVSHEVVDAVTRSAGALLSAPITVVAPDEHSEVTLSPPVLGKALSGLVDANSRTFSLEIDAASLRVAMKSLLGVWERPPQDATFQFQTNGAPLIVPSETGSILDESALKRALLAVQDQAERRIKLPLLVLEPKLSTAEAEGLKVKGLVMSFTTRHPCCQPRVENIHRAAKQLDGVVLRPGEKFSLNELLGPRHESSGYHKAPTIVRGEMEDVHGGGISQLATTLFNVVLRSGYEIIQRQPHSVYFPRYPEGHEATVSYPEPDLIFRNDSEAGLVIKTVAAPTSITVHIYGDNGGRVTSVDKGQRYNIVQPPKEYEADAEMPPEKVKRLRAGQLGWSVVVSRKVKFSDGTEKVEKREVVYKPRPELLRVHPCQIPEGEEGHTGEECPEPDEEIEEEEEELADDGYFETQ